MDRINFKLTKYCTSIAATIAILLTPLSSQSQTITSESNLKISGEVLLGTTTYGGVTPIANRVNSQTVIDDRIRLNIETKFTTQDRLKLRLEAGNSTPLNSSITGTNMTRLGYDGAKNNVSLSLLQYQFPIGDRTQGVVEITGSAYSENLDSFNPTLANSATGAISRFGRYQPIYRLSNDGSGFTLKHQFSTQWSASASYTAPSLTAANPNSGGLFGSANAVIGQVKYAPSQDLKLGVVYARSYHPNGSGVTGATGSLTANNPFNGEPTTAQHYGLNANYQIGKDVTVSGWWGTTTAQSTVNGGANSQSSNFALSLAANNFGGKNNTLGIIVGIPPKSNRDLGTSWHLEAIYKVSVNDNMDITPGLLVITNPEHNPTHPPIWVSTIRTTFRF
jgi:Carbohydrate-selective porin, OprB family